MILCAKWCVPLTFPLAMVCCADTGSYPVSVTNLNVRDPYVLSFPTEGVYRLYMARPWSGGDGVDVLRSTNLVDWTVAQPALRLPQSMQAHVSAYWAPEVHRYRGNYYLFVTLTFSGTTVSRGTWIFSSQAPDGPFEVVRKKPVTPEDWMCLDGTLWVEDGVPYMVFCREWVQTGTGEMFCVRLKDDLSEMDGRPELLFKATDYVAGISVLKETAKYINRVTDGPFLWRSAKSGRLFMIWSNIISPADYVQLVCESPSGSVLGPWTEHRVLCSGDSGHGMVFDKLDGSLALVVHSPNRPPVERMRIISLKDDGRLSLERPGQK